MDAREQIRRDVLEEMIRVALDRSYQQERTIMLSGDHYTYRDLLGSWRIMAEVLMAEHRGLLKYPESEPRLREIQDAAFSAHKEKESELRAQYGIPEEAR